MSFQFKKIWVRIRKLGQGTTDHHLPSVTEETATDIKNGFGKWFEKGSAWKGQLVILVALSLFFMEFGVSADRWMLHRFHSESSEKELPKEDFRDEMNRSISSEPSNIRENKETPKKSNSVGSSVSKPAQAPKKKKKALPAYVMSDVEVAQLLKIAGIPKKHLGVMTCTARYESSYNPRAKNVNKNGTQDTGLFQINDVWLGECGVSRSELTDPLVNAKCARRVLETQGISAWVAYNEKKKHCDVFVPGKSTLPKKPISKATSTLSIKATPGKF